MLAVVCKWCNNSQQCWDLQWIVGRTQPVSLCKPCVMSMRGPNNVGRAVQTDSTLLRYGSAITEQKKCWELLAEKSDQFQTLRNNKQQHPTKCKRVCKRTQHVTSNNVGSCSLRILPLTDIIAFTPVVPCYISYCSATICSSPVSIFFIIK